MSLHNRNSMFVLPPVDPMPINNESDFYGASYIAALYCGFSFPPKPIRGFWQHGVILDEWAVHPYLALGSLQAQDKQAYFWVAKKNQGNYLRSHGYKNVRAIGMPVIYLPKMEAERIPNSLLVMPVHSLDYTTHDHWKFAEYAEQIGAIRHEFSTVLVCIHPSCIQKGYWIEEFRKRGFEVIEGVHGNDRNDFFRLQTLMSTFEFVTTNGVGSQLVYAPYFGAKPSIYGTYAEYQKEDYRDAPAYKKFPEILIPSLQTRSEAAMREHYPFLFVHPGEAKDQSEWAKYEVAERNKISADEMIELFEWSSYHRATFAMSNIFHKSQKKMDQKMFALKRRFRSALSSEDIVKNETDWRIEDEAEGRRLRELPRHVPTKTTFLGKQLRIVDACTFLGGKKEIFEEAIYEFKASIPDPMIIDCGANIGLSVIYFKRLHPEARIIAFEPDPDIFQALEENVQQFNLCHVELHRKAVWCDEREIVFNIEGGFSGRIAKPEDTNFLKVPAIRLKDYLQMPVDFLKLDIEGAETSVIRDCADELRNVHNLFVEYHSHRSEQQSLWEILKIVTEAGFRYQIKEAFVSPKPFVDHPQLLGMDLQLNIFCYR